MSRDGFGGPRGQFLGPKTNQGLTRGVFIEAEQKGEGSPLPPGNPPREEGGIKRGGDQPPQNEAWTPPKNQIWTPKKREGVPKTVAFESVTLRKQRERRGLGTGAGLGPGLNHLGAGLILGVICGRGLVPGAGFVTVAGVV